MKQSITINLLLSLISVYTLAQNNKRPQQQIDSLIFYKTRVSYYNDELKKLNLNKNDYENILPNRYSDMRRLVDINPGIIHELCLEEITKNTIPQTFREFLEQEYKNIKGTIYIVHVDGFKEDQNYSESWIE